VSEGSALEDSADSSVVRAAVADAGVEVDDGAATDILAGAFGREEDVIERLGHALEEEGAVLVEVLRDTDQELSLIHISDPTRPY